MWKFNDASHLGASGMDMRPCPNYENGFDVCDPLGSVLENLEWSGRSPARVLRRRCRSEGVDRSPYEHVSAFRSVDTPFRLNRTLINKSHFTLNTAESEKQNNFFFVSAAENGDYIMAQDHKIHQSYQPGRSKLNKVSSSLHHHQLYKTQLLPNTKMEEQHLPKVEELLDKDYEMMEVPIAKQPLKSILNNPLPKTQPISILKKPKSRIYQDSKEPYHNSEGRRRQRASSESDNLYYSFNYGAPSGCDGRISSSKRPKDNMMNVGYSYGSAIAHVNLAPSPTFPKKLVKEHHPIYSTPVKEEHTPNLHVLRTTAINNNTTEEEPVRVTHPEAPRPTESPPPRVTSAVPKVKVPVPVVVPKKVKANKKKTDKAHKMKSDLEIQQIGKSGDADHHKLLDDKGPDYMNDMETETLIAEIEKLEKNQSPSPPPRLPSPPPRLPSPPPRLPSSNVKKTDPLSSLVLSSQRASHLASRLSQLATQPVSQLASRPASQLASRPEPLASQPASELISQSASQLASQPETQLASLPVAMLPPASSFQRKVVPVLLEKPKEKSTITKVPQTIPPQPAATAAPVIKQPQDAPYELPRSVQTCLRPSLFPRVPPYLRFINHDETPSLKVPMAIQRHLKWKLTSITPIVVKKTLTNSGFRLVRSDCDTAECPQEETLDWVGIWGKHMKSIMFRVIKDGQKMNHFPGTFQIGRKDRLWRNLQKLVAKHGIQEFGIMPKTYVLPYDLKLLKYNWEKHQEDKDRWIIKPPASARGTGIKVVSRWTQIPKKRSVVVQRYVSKPYLINGNKFDMRLYVLVTSVHPLRIYLYKDGLARFASVKYNDEVASLNDRYMHLTNYSINRLSKNYTPNEDFAACEGHKWTLQTLFQYLKTERNVDTESLWESMKDLVIKTIISGEASISSLTKANVASRYNCYELFGVDVLLDEDLKPWLLEVNISPSLHSASPLDIHVKGPLVTTVLNIAQYQVPHKTNLEALSKEKPHRLSGLPYDSRLYTVYLSKEERDKHIIYTNMDDRDMYLKDILSTLTSDDVRHLIQAEDELTQVGDMERVFPTKDTYKYLEFLTGPRYYNRLFDAWESRYTENREAGIQLLRNLCDIGYHLEVPPVPLKNDVDAPSPAPSERPSVHSIASAEHTSSQGTLPTALRTCGDVLTPLAVPPPLEPRA